MISGARARRLLVVALIGAGWLSILGNSPGPDYHVRMVARTGDLTIVPAGLPHSNACHLQASVSTPVRRFASFNGTELILEITCFDGSDCLRRLPDPDRPCEAISDALDGGAASSGREGTPDGAPEITVWGCPATGGRGVQIDVTRGPRSRDYNFCNSESASYRLEVETAAGNKSTFDYKLEIEEPPGYFGCG
jgi:hypothetical protein